jgi:hypothetical protein
VAVSFGTAVVLFYWVVTGRFGGMVHNGCRECTGYYFRRDDRRRSRHESRHELHEYQVED